MKKIIFTLLLFVFALAVIAGCTNQVAENGQEGAANEAEGRQVQENLPGSGTATSDASPSAEEIVADVNTDQVDAEVSDLEEDLENW